MTEKPMTKVEARMACANWLEACLSFGWRREDLDELELIWWRYRDEYGRLKTHADASDASQQ